MSVDHYENFPVASWLCPPRLRPPIAAIYWFARTADDLADEGEVEPTQRLESLAQYRADLGAAAEGRPVSSRWPGVFGPLGAAMRNFDLPVKPLRDLLSAFEQDVVQHDYRDRNELLDYCSRSANPVGRLLLHLHRIDDERSLQQSDAICSALQLANFWQDLMIDARRGRLYVPAADRARHGVDGSALLRGEDSAMLRAALADLVGWTRQLMHGGMELVHTVPGRAGWELRIVVQGGLRILEKIEAMNFGLLMARPRLRPLDAPLLLARALHMRAQRPLLAGTAP